MIIFCLYVQCFSYKIFNNVRWKDSLQTRPNCHTYNPKHPLISTVCPKITISNSCKGLHNEIPSIELHIFSSLKDHVILKIDWARILIFIRIWYLLCDIGLNWPSILERVSLFFLYHRLIPIETILVNLAYVYLTNHITRHEVNHK